MSNKALCKLTSAHPLVSHRPRLLCILVHKLKLDLLPPHMGQYSLFHSGQHLSTRNPVVVRRATNLKSISSLHKFYSDVAVNIFRS